jgi:hypothetical protein
MNSVIWIGIVIINNILSSRTRNSEINLYRSKNRDLVEYSPSIFSRRDPFGKGAGHVGALFASRSRSEREWSIVDANCP